MGHAPELATHIDFMARTMATCGQAALEPGATLAYRRPWPRAPVAQGVMIDDQVTAAVVPLHARHGTATAAEARRLFGATLAAYSAAGAYDVPGKR